MANRLTQVPVEVLSSGKANVKLTQLVIEAMISNNPKSRITQLAVEVLSYTLNFENIVFVCCST